MLLEVVLSTFEDNPNVCNRQLSMKSGNYRFLLNTKAIVVITKAFYLFQSPAK